MPDPRPDRPAAPAVAVVGCGAISEAFHIPALARHAAVRERLVLVDPDLGRAREMAERFGVPGDRVAATHGEILEGVDGAVVATPARLHAPVSRDLLKAGVHVLCEKPLAPTPDEVRELIAVADAEGVTLGVNHMRRLFGASQLVRTAVESGELGELREVEYLQGERFDWPAATGSYFGAAAGKGVLADLGSHIVDLVCWWLGGDLELESYRDDSRGGTEAVAAARFRRNGCEGEIRLSWLTRYRNTYRVSGTKASVEGHLFDERSVTLRDPSGKVLEKRTAPRVDVSHAMIDGFLSAVRGEGPPPVSGRDVLPTVEFIDACYQNRAPLPAPWYENASPVEVA